MLDLLLVGLGNALQWDVLLLTFLGVVIGNLVGSLPGLTPTMAVAVALPVTFALSPVASIAFLMGIAKGGTNGGGLTAIAVGIPGIPASTCTMLDGYPLSQQGKSGKAMEMAVYASTMGDLFSDIVLIVAAAPLASIALGAGAPEQAAIIFFALLTVGSVTGDEPLKGLLAAAVGLFLGTIGMDPISGSPRLAFGSLDLMGGLSIIPVLVGLFAIPEILAQVKALRSSGSPDRPRTAVPEARPGDRDANRVTWTELKESLPTILRGGIIGTVVGAIPGIGSSVAAFINYSESKRRSRNPELFGKGALEGVAAAESANSAVNGANLIPLLTLGVPGETISAVLLGAFTLHGLHPGPLLIQQHGPLIYTMFAAMLIANVLNLVFGKEVMIRIVRRVIRAPLPLLLPVIAVLCVAGSYAVNNSMFDVAVMAIFGLVGYGMVVYGYPRTPLIIALLLGPILEPALRQSLLMGTPAQLLMRPGVIVFLVLTLVLAYVLIRRGMARGEASGEGVI